GWPRPYFSRLIPVAEWSVFRRFAGGVAEVQNFDQPLVLADLVVHQDRTVGEFTYPSALANCGAHSRGSREQLHMIEQGIAEAFRGSRIILGNVADNFRKALQRFLGEEESEIHLGRSSLTLSMGTVRPDLASRSPSSIAARVASSSSSTTGTSDSNSVS